MTQQLAVGVIGTGFGGQVLTPAFRLNPQCDVVAVSASTREQAQRAARQLNIPKAYGDWHELVEDPAIDAVAIATPPVVQLLMIEAALKRGKPVFCEKPVATTRRAAADLLALADSSHVAHMVDFEFPAIETWKQAKALLEQRVIGRVRHVVVSWQVQTYANRVGLDSWKRDVEQGGGALNLFVSHVFHYLEWLIGPIRRLSAYLAAPGRREEPRRGETFVALSLDFLDGVPASVTVSTDAPHGTGHRIEIYGTEDSLVLENATGDYVKGFRLLRGTRQPVCAEPIEVGQSGGTQDGRVLPVAQLVNGFVTWIQQGTPATPSLADGYRVQCLLEAARRADVIGGWVDALEV